jgi:F-type H+-transporting ATPase subunit b
VPVQAFTVSVTGAGHVRLQVPAGHVWAAQEEEGTTEEPSEGPSPIAPELKELAWGVGSFVVFLILVRLVFYPRIKKGMEARYGLVREQLEQAERTRADADKDVAEYQAKLAEVRAEATKRIDAARQVLEEERQDRLAEVNARIAERRAAALAEIEAAKDAARSHVVDAAADVGASAAQRILGRPVEAAAARSAAELALAAEVAS